MQIYNMPIYIFLFLKQKKDLQFDAIPKKNKIFAFYRKRIIIQTNNILENE